MNTTRTLLARLTLAGVACLACHTQAAFTNVDQNSFHLQLHTTMRGIGAGAGPQGWTTSLYGQRGPLMNQVLQIGCRGLATNQVYHLMASVGTNGDLMHLADFRPNAYGGILMQYLTRPMQHFAGTNNPGQAWGMMGGWTNHMSWVVFPESGTNWCDSLASQAAEPSGLSMMEGSTGGGAMTDPGQTSGMGGRGTLGQAGISGGMMGGGMGMGGMGAMSGSGWPAMSNWWSGMSNWWPAMANWCWDYTNMWNSGMASGGASTNWWGNLGRSGAHVMPLPAAISPVPAVNGLVVMDANLQLVLAADLANPDSFGYQARCVFTNQGIAPGARAVLQAAATRRATRFGLAATGLAPRTAYFIAMNGANLTPVTTDRYGRLRMRGLPSGVTSLRNIGSVAILDGNSNTLLSATLPPE